jgi:hypothetical protein
MGEVLPPIPFNDTIGMPYSLQDLILVKYFGCARDTEPQESNLNSHLLLIKEPLSPLYLILKLALLISFEPGEINRSSDMKKSLHSECSSCH